MSPLLALAALWLNAPAQGEDDVDLAPEDVAMDLQILELRDVDVDLSGATFTVVLQATSEAWPRLVILGLDYDLNVNGVQVGGATQDDDKVILPKGQPVVMELPARVDAASFGPALMRSALKGRLEVSVAGEIRVRRLLVTRTVPFETEIYP